MTPEGGQVKGKHPGVSHVPNCGHMGLMGCACARVVPTKIKSKFESGRGKAAPVFLFVMVSVARCRREGMY